MTDESADLAEGLPTAIPLALATLGDVRNFPILEIDKEIREALATLPPEAHVGVVAHYDVGEKDVAVSVYGRVLNNHLSWMLTADKAYGKPINGKAELIAWL